MDQERKLLYIVNIDFPPTSGPGVWRMLALAKYAAQAGHRVHVFCADRSFWHNRSDKSLLNQLPDSVKITRIPCVYEEDILRALDAWRQSSNRLKRALGKALYWRARRYLPDEIAHWVLKAGVRIALAGIKEKPDAIITTGPMHLVHVAGCILTWVRRKTVWTMDYRDPWGSDPAYGLVHPGPYQPGLMAWLEKRLVERATWVTAVTPGFLAPLIPLSSSPSKFKVITNGHDLEIDRSSWSARTTRTILTSPDARTLVIHFNGTIQDNNDVFESLFRVLVAYRNRATETALPAVRFSFCGIKEKVLVIARQLGVEDAIDDHGPLSQVESQRVSRAADVLLVTVRTGLVSSCGVVPAKLYEAIALGKPILALVPNPSHVRDILADDDGSLCLTSDDEPALLDGLRVLVRGLVDGSGPLGALGSEQAQGKRLALAQKYSRKNLSAEMLELMGFSS